jgi:hypothetical protein
MVTPDEFRRLALAKPGAVEGAHMGHPDFRANGRIFATLHSGDAQGMVKLTLEQQRDFVRRGAGAFAPGSGAWGRQGCTNVHLAGAERALVGAAMDCAWQVAIETPPPRSKAKAKSKRPKRKRD